MENIPCEPSTLEGYKNDLSHEDVDTETKRRIICQIKIWTSLEDAPPIREIIQSDIIPELFLFSDNPLCDPKMLFDITWIHSNLCACSSQEIKYMMTLGVDDYFIDLLSQSIPQIIELAMWGLGNIAGDSPKQRDDLLYKNLVQKLNESFTIVSQKKNVPDSYFQTLGWLLSQLSRGKPRVKSPHVDQILPILRQLLFMNKLTSFPDVLWGISYLTDEGEALSGAVANSTLFDKITELLKDQYGFSINHPALRIVANLASSSAGATNKLFSTGAVKEIVSRFLEYNPQLQIVRKEACWCLSNVAAGTLEQARRLIALEDLPDKIIRILRDKQDIEVQQELMWMVVNFLKQNDIIIFKFLLMNDILSTFSTEINHGDKVMVDLFFTAAKQSVAFLLKVPLDTFEAKELEKLILILHYFNTTMINLRPTLVTGPIRQSCRDLKDAIDKIKLKFNLPENLSQKVIPM